MYRSHAVRFGISSDCSVKNRYSTKSWILPQQDGAANAEDEEHDNAQHHVQLDVDARAHRCGGQHAHVHRAHVLVVLLHRHQQHLIEVIQPGLQRADFRLHRRAGFGGVLRRVRRLGEGVDDVLAVRRINQAVGLAVEQRHIVADERVVDRRAVFDIAVRVVLFVDVAQHEAVLPIRVRAVRSGIVQRAFLILIAIAFNDFLDACHLVAIGAACQHVIRIPLLILFQQDFAVLRQLFAQNLRKQVRNPHRLDIAVFIKQVGDGQTRARRGEIRRALWRLPNCAIISSTELLRISACSM